MTCWALRLVAFLCGLAVALPSFAAFYRAFVIIVLLILLYLAVAVLRVYLDQTLQLRWRRWLTDQYVTRWLADRVFYRMRFSGRSTTRINESPRTSASLSNDPCHWVSAFLTRWRR